MIVTCPACATRYQTDAAKFPADGRQVRCAKCGHVWHQPGPEPAEPAPVSDSVPGAAPIVATPAPATPGAPADAPAAEPLSRTRSFVSRPQPVADTPRPPLLAILGVILGWTGLIAVVLLVGFSAVRYRQEITVIWPQSAGVYNSLGMKVNTHGVDFAHVAYHRESEDGDVVLAVSGRIVNSADRELPVPQTVEVTLSDGSNHELYHWTFTPAAQTLKPGQSIPFLTRLSNPPPAARHLEVHFARGGK